MTGVQTCALPISPPSRIGYCLKDFVDYRIGLEVYPSEEEKNWIRKLYYAEVAYIDSCIGIYMDKLRDSGIYDRSMIIITADHGEEFWEHNEFEHGHNMHREVINVPLIIKFPYQKRQIIVDEKVSMLKLAPTILHACGIEYDENMLQPFVYNNNGGLLLEDDLFEEEIYCDGTLYYDYRKSVIYEDYKFMRSTERDYHRLYDIEKDPLETDPFTQVSEGVISAADSLFADYRDWSEEVRIKFSIEEEDALNRKNIDESGLRSIGYAK